MARSSVCRVSCACPLLPSLAAIVAALLLLYLVYYLTALAVHVATGIPVYMLYSHSTFVWLVVIIMLLMAKTAIMVWRYAQRLAEHHVVDYPVSSLEFILVMLTSLPIILYPVLLDDFILAVGVAFSKMFIVLGSADVTPGLLDLLNPGAASAANILSTPVVGGLSLGALASLAARLAVVAFFVWNDVKSLVERVESGVAFLTTCLKYRCSELEVERKSAITARSLLCRERCDSSVDAGVVQTIVRTIQELTGKVISIIGATASLEKLRKCIREKGAYTLEEVMEGLIGAHGVGFTDKLRLYVKAVFTIVIDLGILVLLLIAM